MKQVIYIDILIVVNLFVNYFVLLATAKFLCLKWKIRRLIFGEILGALYSFYIFVPEFNFFISLTLKLFMSFTIIWATFGIKNLKIFIKTLACFYSINFAFSGSMFALWCMWKPNGMSINNGIVYFDISPKLLIVSTLISYIVLELIHRITGKKETTDKWCEIKISFKDKQTLLNAKIDTGNSLREPFSNLPVIVARENAVAKILPPNFNFQITQAFESEKTILNNLSLKLRMIPFKTVSGNGVLPAFKPDFINTPDGIQKEAYIAICSDKILPKETPALINPDILN